MAIMLSICIQFTFAKTCEKEKFTMKNENRQLKYVKDGFSDMLAYKYAECLAAASKKNFRQRLSCVTMKRFCKQ